MKKIISTLILGLIIAAGACWGVPQYFNYQGILRDLNGNLQTGAFTMTFKIYDVESAGTEVYNSGATTVSVSNGLYNVPLPANASVFNGAEKWLEVTIGSEALSPRLKINSVAYAITADTATSATTATNATNANYATLSGTATNAGNADTVDNIHASSTATANYLYPLDSTAKLSGVAVSAEANGSNTIALFVNGKLGASGAVVGTGTIIGGGTRITVNNTAVTINSKIFLTPASANAIDTKFIKVETVASGSFDVSTWDEQPTVSAIPFNYLIIN